MTVADKVLIVRNEHEPFERVPYVIHLLIKLWRQQGLEVDVTTALNAPTGEDVLVFPHFDLTMTPPDLAQMLSRCARVVNRRVLDISKRTISRQLVTSPDEYEGRVIVKTNLNYAACLASSPAPRATRCWQSKRNLRASEYRSKLSASAGSCWSESSANDARPSTSESPCPRD